ncbi:Rab11 [Hexamita inflata]|uniref:Rab11 n=1 Tax=Hexamita inflata TaxID=28002 RepID=A0AA86RCX7_9EUKA|nr:Rab11 [Hexamita inflata]
MYYQQDNYPLQTKEQHIKLVFVGASATGKTSIIQRFVYGVFSELPTTLSLALEKLQLERNNYNVHLQLWDTAGQERFDAITPTYYRSCQAIAIVCSGDQRDSLAKAQFWYHQVRQYADENVQIALIYNKIDLMECELSDSILNQFTQQYQIPLFKTSAKTGEGIESTILSIVDSCQVNENDSKQELVKIQRSRCCQ